MKSEWNKYVLWQFTLIILFVMFPGYSCFGQNNPHKPPFISLEENKYIIANKLKATKLDLSRILIPAEPSSVDYSSYLTYIRNQNYGGGCITYSSLHAADIINEFQAPYTPDLSWQYARRTWDELKNDYILSQHSSPPADVINTFKVGISSEGLCRSESDYLTPVSSSDPVLAREHSQKVGQTTLAALREKICSLSMFHRPAL